MKKLSLNRQNCDYSAMLSQVSYPNCDILISGPYSLPILLELSKENQGFIFEFVWSKGSLKSIVAEMCNN